MNLEISRPEKISDSSFKISINDNDFEYQISEDKDIDKVIDKISTWLERGPESYGGLYDYIKRSYKLVGPYEESIEEVEVPEDTGVDIPSDNTNVDEVISGEDQLEFDVHVDEQKVKISLNDWTGTFDIIESDEDFVDIIHENVNEEMTLKDRVSLLINLVRNLDADDLTDFYNLFNLVLNNDVDIIDNIDDPDLEIEEPEEEPIDLDISNGLDNAESEESNDETGKSVGDEESDLNDSEKIEGDVLTEDMYEPSDMSADDFSEGAPTDLNELINDESFIEDLINLDLSLFQITKEDSKDDVIYFIGGVNNKGNKFSLSYEGREPIELSDQYDELKDLNVCLNNIEDLKIVTDYINKLLNFVYNKEIGGNDE